jgi:hypothetical protein
MFGMTYSNVGFMVDTVALGQVSLRVLRFSLLRFHRRFLLVLSFFRSYIHSFITEAV